MNLHWQGIQRLTILVSVVTILGGCAAGKMFMAGYTPPQTIADLINEQYNLAGEIPPEIDINKRGNKPITLANLDIVETPKAPIQAQQDYQLQAPVQRFAPKFTYKSVQDYAGQLAMSLVKNGNGLSRNARIGISSFVKLDTSLQNTTVLGNQLAEYSIAQMQQFGLTVIDFKLMPALQVASNGDIAFSRDVIDLANNNIMDHVLSGTMIEKYEGVFINARIIKLGSNQVVASASVLVPHFVVQQSQPRFMSYSAD